MFRSLIQLIALTATLGFSAHSIPAAGDNTAEIDQARLATQALQQQLSSRLQKAIAEGGLEQGIEVCAQEAPRIAAAISDEFGKNVSRTALRVRNPGNRPDPTQQAALQFFAEKLKQQQDPARLEYFSQQENGRFIYMRPIVMQSQCLACHGEINKQLRSRIERHYPADQATGFKTGDLRGAFVVTW